MFPPNTRILVVDDSPTVRRLMTETLHQMGFSDIVTAEDANQAHDKLTRCQQEGNSFDLVLSDLSMPGPSGIEFLKQVRASEEFKNLPFVLVTMASEKGAVIEAAVSGVSSYVVKPFNSEILSKRLEEAWRKHFPEDS